MSTAKQIAMAYHNGAGMGGRRTIWDTIFNSTDENIEIGIKAFAKMNNKMPGTIKREIAEAATVVNAGPTQLKFALDVIEKGDQKGYSIRELVVQLLNAVLKQNEKTPTKASRAGTKKLFDAMMKGKSRRGVKKAASKAKADDVSVGVKIVKGSYVIEGSTLASCFVRLLKATEEELGFDERDDKVVKQITAWVETFDEGASE